MCTFESLISDRAQGNLRRSVENTAAVEARAKDIASWYEQRNPYARCKDIAEEYELRQAENDRINKELDEMEADFLGRLRNDASFRSEMMQAREAVKCGNPQMLPDGWVMCEMCSGHEMIKYINSMLDNGLDPAIDCNGVTISNGDRVLWTDPEDASTGIYTVFGMPTSSLVTIANEYSEAEVLPDELRVITQ